MKRRGSQSPGSGGGKFAGRNREGGESPASRRHPLAAAFAITSEDGGRVRKKVNSFHTTTEHPSRTGAPIFMHKRGEARFCWFFAREKGAG